MNRIMKKTCCILLIAAGFSAYAETLTWYGQDGGLWSTLGNWTNSLEEAAVPQDGDVLVIPSRTDAFTLENDIDGLTLKRIVFTGTGAAVTLTGKAYALDNTSFYGQQKSLASYFTECPFLAEECIVTNVPAVTLKSSRADNRHFAICSSNDLTFASAVSSDVPGTIYIEGPGSSGVNIRFLGCLTAPSATIVGRSSTTVNFNAPIHVKYICYPTKYSASWTIHFNATGNVFEEIMLGPFGTFDMAAADSIPSDTILRWNYEYSGSKSTYTIHAETTIDHVAAYEPPLTDGSFDDGKYVVWGYSDTLTMRSTTNLVTYAKFIGWFNLTWDPVDDYTCEFRDRENDLKGYALNVKRGGAVLSGKTVFKSAKTLTIGENAYVDVAATNGVVWPALVNLTMNYGSRLYITNDAVQAFTAGSPSLTIKDGAYIQVGDTATAPTFKTVTAYGVPIEAGSYTGVDGVVGATKVPWLRGSAVVTVANTQSTTTTYWKEPVDGNWNEATKWTQGVPNSSHPASVTAQCSDYTVTISDAVTQQYNLTVGNSPYHSAVLAIKAPVNTSGNRNLTLGVGARMDVQANGEYKMAGTGSPILTINPGAELRVSGGTCVLTNKVVENMVFAGTCARTATVSVTSGRLVAVRTGTKPFRVGDYGLLSVSGGEVVMDNECGYQTPYHRLSVAPEGRVEFSGSGRLKVSRSYTGAPFGSGETTFTGNSAFVPDNQEKANNMVCGTTFGVYAEQPGETAVLTFSGQAMHEHASLGYANFQVGGLDTNSATCRAIANFNSPVSHGSRTNGVDIGTSTITAKAFIGCGNGYGELNVTDGFVAFGLYGTRIGSVVNTSANLSDTANSLGCTGVCHVSGGVLCSLGHRGWAPTPVPNAMLIGWGWPTTSELDRPYNGFMVVTGGVVSNDNCSTVIGMGKGYGEWQHGGGTAILKSEGAKIGLAGGVGLLSVSGGTFTSMYDTYVGGAPVSAFNKGSSLEEIGYPVHSHDGVGTLKVSGGRFEVKGYASSKLYVGADGDGTIEMDGPDGTFVVPQLVLAAGTVESGTEYEAQTKATLRFKLDAEGNVAPIEVTSTLTISEDSELVVDATACPDGVSRRVKLIKAGSVSGSFDQSNITILGDPKVISDASVAWRGTSLVFRLGMGGMVINLR